MCPHCALTRTERSSTAKPKDGLDSRLGLPLWLTISCCGGQMLWAHNEQHLNYLEQYIGAELRERPPPPSRLAWALPAWMKEAKHRQEVLRSLQRLRVRLPAI